MYVRVQGRERWKEEVEDEKEWIFSYHMIWDIWKVLHIFPSESYVKIFGKIRKWWVALFCRHASWFNFISPPFMQDRWYDELKSLSLSTCRCNSSYAGRRILREKLSYSPGLCKCWISQAPQGLPLPPPAPCNWVIISGLYFLLPETGTKLWKLSILHPEEQRTVRRQSAKGHCLMRLITVHFWSIFRGI